MARNRMLNPEFWLDEEIAKLSPHARLLYMGLWGICDDNYATLPNRPDWIKAQVFPYEFVEIKTFLKELADIKKIILFKKDDEEYWFIKNFHKYQRVDHPSDPKYPKYSSKTLDEDSPNTPRPLALNISKVKLSEVNIIYMSYKEKINKLSRLTDGAKRKIEARLKEYSPEDLKTAIDKFSQDKWWMEHNADRGVAWFFHSDDRIDQFLNLKPRIESRSSPVIDLTKNGKN